MAILVHMKFPTAKDLCRHLALEDQINHYGLRKRGFPISLSKGGGYALNVCTFFHVNLILNYFLKNYV